MLGIANLQRVLDGSPCRFEKKNGLGFYFCVVSSLVDERQHSWRSAREFEQVLAVSADPGHGPPDYGHPRWLEAPATCLFIQKGTETTGFIEKNVDNMINVIHVIM